MKLSVSLKNLGQVWAGVFLLLGVVSAQAQSGNAAGKQAFDAAPETVTKAFESRYAGASELQWKKTKKGKYEATFIHSGKKTKAKFLADGTWDASAVRLSQKELPVGAAEYLKKNYPSHTINKIEYKEDKKGTKVYEVKVVNARAGTNVTDASEVEVTFDANGKFKKVKNKSDESE